MLEKELELKQLLDEIIEGQKKKVFSLGRQIIPTLTAEDVLQPNDYENLEHNPLFRYEEGVLEGVQTVQMALNAFFQDNR